MARSFLDALADFLSMAALSVNNPTPPPPLVSRLAEAQLADQWVSPGGITLASTVSFTGLTFADSMILPNIPAEGAMVLVDDRGRPHSANSPAAVFPDGGAKYYWHGVHVPEYVVKEPQLITPQAIDEEHNQEIRRVMVERYGINRYIADCGAKLIQQDECGELYGKDKAPDTWEPLRFVKVKNSTAEPDGTFKDYFIRVPPDMATAKAGVSWTFRVNPKDYAPHIQT